MFKFLGLVLICGLAIGCSRKETIYINSDDGGGGSKPQPGSEKLSEFVLPQYDQEIASAWKLVSRVSELAKTQEELDVLKAKYPEYFDTLSENEKSQMVYAEAVKSQYEYVGKTVCKSTDPRLTFTVMFFDLCGSDSKKSSYWCLSAPMKMPNTADPCTIK